MAERKGELALLVGAILLFLGPALTFVTLKADASLGVASESETGYGTGDSSSYVLAGILIAVALVVTALSKSAGLRKGMAVLAIIGGAFALFAGIVDISGNADIPAELDGLVEISSGIGTYVVTLGAVIALIGGVLLLKGGSGATAAPAAPPAAPPAA